ncbi:Tyrosine-protein phosphatase [Apiospora kogelbergensis]|uniref:Tyrosine-protein phosphatase n=1 Tax=Apiospora kogelbergensis TaxID=1337665 RepID=A0AAW0QX51_9PEZI
MANASELRKLAETDTIQEIPKEQYGPVITNPPFVFVDGSFNTRDLGLVPDSPIRAGFIYRSGALTTLTDNGKAVMAGKLGIKRVFDIRSPEEREKGPDPEIEGVENTWHRNARPDSTPDLDKFVSGVGEAGYEDMYLEVIDVYSAAWKDILEHIRDRPSDPLMYHCTAGRDRTGVISGLLLTLAGASPDTVTLDYLLSRIGTEPVRKHLLAFAMAGTHAKSEDQPGFLNLCSLTAASWHAFVNGVQRDYGGFEKFVTEKLGFSVDDVAIIKKNLTTS